MTSDLTGVAAGDETISKERLYRRAGGLPAGARILAAALGALLLAAGSAAQVPPAPEHVAAPPADAERSSSGLAWKVLAAGAGKLRPDANDLVRVHFTGWTPQGATIHSTRADGKEAVFDLSTVFPAWREAMRMMVVGDQRLFWIPEDLAPKDAKSGVRQAATFEIEMVGIGPVPNPPDDLETLPSGAEKTPSGALTERLEAGWGDEKPAADSVAVVNYIGWTTDGKSFDASYSRGRPTGLPLGKVMPAFAEAVRKMVVGEKRRIWIPGNVAAGNWVGSPKGTLIFEVELVQIQPGDVLQYQDKEQKPASG